MYHVPDYKLEPMEPVVFHYCDCCSGEIYEGDEMYNIGGDMIHEDCLEDYFSEYKCIAERVSA